MESIGTVVSEMLGGDREKLRGPRPPALVCNVCDRTIAEYWTNPFLLLLKSRGTYAGETTGGKITCEACLAAAERTNQEKRERAPRDVRDCPAKELDATLATYEARPGTEKALRVAADWIRRPDRDLFLFGPTGVGKTRLAISLAREMARSRRVAGDVIFARVPTLIRRIKAAFTEGASDDLSKIETYVKAGLLVLDDLGAENGTTYTRTTIEGIYNDRLDADRRTIVTSNLPLGMSLLDIEMTPDERVKNGRYRETLSEFLGDDRLSSRLAGNAQQVEIIGDDYRAGGWKKTRRREGTE